MHQYIAFYNVLKADCLIFSVLWSFIMKVYLNFQIVLAVESLTLLDCVLSDIFVDMSQVNRN